MRGAGHSVFVHDFLSGEDMVGDVLNGPMAQEKMEFELFCRLGATEDG